MARQARKRYTPEFKLQAVLESLQQGTTQEEVRRRFGISNSLLHLWREEFQRKAATVFLDQRNPKHKALVEGYVPGESPAELKKVIENLRQENAILKSAGALGRISIAEKVRLAHQFSQPNDPYSKSQVARALGLARGTLYGHSKQAMKDQQIANAIALWHEVDATFGHRPLARLLRLGKHRVRRVMLQYGIPVRSGYKPYRVSERIFLDQSHSLPYLTKSDEVVFSRPFVVSFADGTTREVKFLLLKSTRHCLGLFHKEADLHEAPIELLPYGVSEIIWQYGQKQWLSGDVLGRSFMNLGSPLSEVLADIVTDHDCADQFIKLFELLVEERQSRWEPQDFWRATTRLANRYNRVITFQFVCDYWLKFCPPTAVTWIGLSRRTDHDQD